MWLELPNVAGVGWRLEPTVASCVPRKSMYWKSCCSFAMTVGAYLMPFFCIPQKRTEDGNGSGCGNSGKSLLQDQMTSIAVPKTIQSRSSMAQTK